MAKLVSDARDAVPVAATAAPIASHSGLQDYILEASEKSTAMVAMVGNKRGVGRKNKHKEGRAARVGLKVDLKSGDDRRKHLLPFRLAVPFKYVTSRKSLKVVSCTNAAHALTLRAPRLQESGCLLRRQVSTIRFT